MRQGETSGKGFVLLAIGFGLTCGAPTTGQEIPNRGISLTLGIVGQYETNALRLPQGLTPAQIGIDSDQRSDFTFSPLISLSGAMEYARQRFFLQAVYSQNLRQNFDQFDTDLLNFRAGWVWQAGNHWDGELSIAQEQTNSDFEDFLGPSRNVLTIRSAQAIANFKPRPDRRVSVIFDGYDGRNSIPLRALNNFEIQATRIETGASTAIGNELIVGYRYTRGLYPNRDISPVLPIDNSYRQVDADLGARWAFGKVSSLDLRLGYGWRRYNEISERDFTGPVGRAVLRWQATPQVLVEASVVRDLGAVEDFDSLYAISTNYVAVVQYNFLPKWTLSGTFIHRDIDYGGDPGFLVGLQFPRRADTITDAQVALIWNPTSRWRVILAQQHLERDSNRSQYQYTTNISQLTTQYRFGN